MTTLASGFANIFGALGSLFLRLRDRLQPSGGKAGNEAVARGRFKDAVAAIRRANAGKNEEDVKRDVDDALREVREARRTASGR